MPELAARLLLHDLLRPGAAVIKGTNAAITLVGRSGQGKRSPWPFMPGSEIARELLLADPKARVNDVARAVGFSGSETFIRPFQRMSGMTPGEFARRTTARR